MKIKTIVFSLLVFLSGYASAGIALVPGSTNPNVTQENIKTTICVPGFTKTIRPRTSYTNRLKAAQIDRFKLSGDMKDFEEDHLIPLTLGGNPSDPNNLWPQKWEGDYGARKKDRLEVRLNRLVCTGHIPLAEAQRAIAIDWISAYDKYVVKKSR